MIAPPPPEPEIITSWWCPSWWCKPKTDTTKLDICNEIMDLYNGDGDEDAPKAITVWFGRSDGKVGRFDSDQQLKTVFQAAAARNTCVEETFADAVCYTIHFSDIFNAKTLSGIQHVKNLDTFRKFVLGVVKGNNPVQIANNAKKLIENVLVPAMYKVIGGISYLSRIDPDSRFKLQLLGQCSIY